MPDPDTVFHRKAELAEKTCCPEERRCPAGQNRWKVQYKYQYPKFEFKVSACYLTVWRVKRFNLENLDYFYLKSFFFFLFTWWLVLKLSTCLLKTFAQKSLQINFIMSRSSLKLGKSRVILGRKPSQSLNLMEECIWQHEHHTSQWVPVPPWNPCSQGQKYKQLSPGDKTFQELNKNKQLCRNPTCPNNRFGIVRCTLYVYVVIKLYNNNAPCCPPLPYWFAAPCKHVTRSPYGENQIDTGLPFLVKV